MEWLFDPTAWAGLMTLVVMEIVLGIDNLIFIAILSDKLPPHQRHRARIIGLSLALGMRLLLLISISWMMHLNDPLFAVIGHDISGRDLIMLLGGAFLIFKATMELHEKLEGSHRASGGPVNYAVLWQVIVQIVVLDAVFSLDAVITAVGMSDHLEVMMLAVLIAMGLMIVASNRLMNFVSAHPTVVILCLGFLLMIGFSLVVEGLGYHIPKGYLYAAIAFSILIESFNQLAQRNRRKMVKMDDLRGRTSRAVLSLLGGVKEGHTVGEDVAVLAQKSASGEIFGEQERLMIQRVLHLAEQSIQSIMTPRQDLYWIDLNDDAETLRNEIRDCPYSCLVVAKDGEVGEALGIIQKKDLADMLLEEPKALHIKDILSQPIVIPDSLTVLHALDSFRNSRIHVAFIVDEYGTLEGLVTLTDVVEAIAGELPENHEGTDFQFQLQMDGSIMVNGNLSLLELSELLGSAEFPEGDYHTAAGIALGVLKRIPKIGDSFSIRGWRVVVEEMDKRRITRMRFIPDDTMDVAI